MRRTPLTLGTALALAAIGIATPATAQVAGGAPTREEVLRGTGEPAPPQPMAEIEAEDGIERAPCPLANAEFAGLRFTLSTVQFTNAGPIDPALLAPAWADRVGTEVPVSAICDIRDRAATILRRAGYLAAVRVPVQRIENGVVQLDILAARLTGIQVRGDAGANEAQLARYLRQLEGQPLFNAHDAERYLLLASGIPGLNARLTLRPTGTPGEVIGEVTVLRTPAFLDIDAQNLGTRSVGRFGGMARLRVNGITGMGDETGISAYSTVDFEEQRVVQGTHQFRVGGEGLTLGTSLVYAWTRPTLPGNVPLRSNTFVWTSYARYPLTLRQTRSTWLSAGFDWIDQDLKLGPAPLSRDHLRVAWARLDASWIHPGALTGRFDSTPAEPHWQASLTLEARQGIAGLGASNGCRANPLACFSPGAIPVSRIEADPSAFVLRASGDFAVRAGRNFTWAVSPRAQYAARPLLGYEEFSGGNFTVGRGYDPGSVIGDSGVAVSTEFRFLSLVPRDQRSLAWQPFAFVDTAWVWNEDASFAGFNPQRLASIGGGVRLAYGNLGRLEVTVAEPLRAVGFIPVRPATRLLISLTTQFGFGR